MIDLDEFDFPLDESKIARYPTTERDGSKLMVVERKSGKIYMEPVFRNIENYLIPGDAVFFNETRVSPRRVYLRGGKNFERIHEAVFLELIPGTRTWSCILRNTKKLQKGDELLSPSGGVQFVLLEKEEGTVLLDSRQYIGEDFFQTEGKMPIPPYLKRPAEDIDTERYQSIFAKTPGSVASPTASLHMTEALRDKLLASGIEFHPLLLEIGFGTFKPLTEDNLKEKKLHKEKITIPARTIQKHEEQKKNGRRRIAMGTTTLRAWEAYSRTDNSLKTKGEDWNGETEIFLAPGDKIDTIDGLITNFHLPKSSLILLVAAFAGVELTKLAYKTALENNFRFFSYGDAMFII